jgi:hypothetical protein
MEAEDGADGRVAVEAYAVAVGRKHEEDVEQEFVGVEGGKEAVFEEAVRKKTESLAGDLTHALGDDGGR